MRTGSLAKDGRMATDVQDDQRTPTKEGTERASKGSSLRIQPSPRPGAPRPTRPVLALNKGMWSEVRGDRHGGLGYSLASLETTAKHAPVTHPLVSVVDGEQGEAVDDGRRERGDEEEEEGDGWC